jgi:hypothetical protein
MLLSSTAKMAQLTVHSIGNEHTRRQYFYENEILLATATFPGFLWAIGACSYWVSLSHGKQYQKIKSIYSTIQGNIREEKMYITSF